jgi:hypothetical protein
VLAFFLCGPPTLLSPMSPSPLPLTQQSFSVSVDRRSHVSKALAHPLLPMFPLLPLAAGLLDAMHVVGGVMGEAAYRAEEARLSAVVSAAVLKRKARNCGQRLRDGAHRVYREAQLGAQYVHEHDMY